MSKMSIHLDLQGEELNQALREWATIKYGPTVGEISSIEVDLRVQHDSKTSSKVGRCFIKINSKPKD